MATPFNDDLLEQLLHKGTSPMVEVRVGAAIGLRRLAQSNLLDAPRLLGSETTQRCQDALAILANDVSFRVRREATCPQQKGNNN